MRILIAGTDTGVGKTWVGCALARALRAAGHRVVAVKPVETGCGEEEHEGEDGVFLAKSTGQAEPTAALVRLADPVAPALALELAGRDVEFGELRSEIERHAVAADVLLLEGAGGLLTPITWDWNATDLARAFGAWAVVVGSDRLGVINHALLTLDALARAGVPVLGVVLSAPEVPDRSTGTNARAIARLSGVERILAAPRTSEPAEAAQALAPVLGWLESVDSERFGAASITLPVPPRDSTGPHGPRNAGGARGPPVAP
ncbi:MAG: dethiobiotin synthase [Gemmatimonadales bacterium]